jgi:hypothetical protein
MPRDYAAETTAASTMGERNAVTSQHSNYAQRTQTPEWVIRVGESLVSSYIEGFKEHTECFSWGFKLSKPTNPSATGPLYSSAVVTISDIQVVISNTDSSTTLEYRMMVGEALSSVSLKRIANINGVNVVALNMEFTNCFIQSIEPYGDMLKMTFKCTHYKKTAYRFDQNGDSKGQTEVSFCFETGVAK